MNSRKIWVLAILFGLLSSLCLYFILFQSDVIQNADERVELDENSIVNEDDDHPIQEQSPPNEKEEEDLNKQSRNENKPLLIEPGHRAISIAVSEVEGVAGYLQPGDYVDLIVIADVDQQQEVNKDGEAINPISSLEQKATILLQNIKVLATGKAGKAIDYLDDENQYQTVTVEVKPEQGLKLGLATKWSIYLMLRNEGDQEMTPQISEIVTNDLFERGNQ